MRRLWAVVLGVLSATLAGHVAGHVAWADPGARDNKRPVSVAVLPFAATDEHMQMYGKPVADAVARALSQALPRTATSAGVSSAATIDVRAISLSGKVPEVDWVIDGRIVSASPGRVSLEAQVRDPVRGKRVTRMIGTRAAQLTDIDELARALGIALAPHIESVVRGRPGESVPGDNVPKDTRAHPVAQKVDTAAATAHDDAGAAAHDDARATAHDDARATAHDDARAAARDDRQAMVIFQVSGRVSGGAVEIHDIAARAGVKLARSLGYRPVMSSTAGIRYADTAARDVRAHGAAFGLMMDVRDIRFSWLSPRRGASGGVLMARGRFRAVLIDAQGNQLYNVAHRTGTVVGSRGDRHSALVGYIMAQAMDILRPRLARLMARRRP